MYLNTPFSTLLHNKLDTMHYISIVYDSLIKIAEIIIATVENIMGAVLIRNFRHHLWIVDLYFGNMHESRNLSLNNVKRVHLDATLVLAEFSPLGHCQAKVNRGWTEDVNMTVKLKDFLSPPLACLSYHKESELLKDAVVPLLVSFAKIAHSHWLPDSELIDLAGMGFQSDDEIPQALPVWKLPEYHHK